jgi:RNA polymerase sigma-70 factor (ECF subfamily)
VDIETSDPRGSLERAMAGDFDAYGEVYRAYSTRLLRHAMALCGNTALAEELAQDTLVEAWKYLRRYNGRCEFFTWLCAILLNRYRKDLRRRRPLPISSSRDQDEIVDAIANLKDQGSSPDEAADLADQTTLVRRCIESLPVKHQQVIYLRFYVDDSLDGIAAALGCSLGTVKSRLFHALDKLRGMNAMNTQFMNLKTRS